MFVSATKPQAVRASLDVLEEACSRFDLPVAAIGGITVGNAAQVVAAGADLLAVISNLFNAMDIRTRAGDFQRLFEAGQRP
jgi:thiamine-phosphate pyrophosphorylase